MLSGCAWASASGRVPQRWPWDSIEHFLLALAWCRWVGEVLLRSLPAERRASSRLLVCLAAFGATAACGIVWELVEWSADALFGTAMSPSDADTVTDLGVDLLGALASTVWLAASLRRENPVLPPPVAG